MQVYHVNTAGRWPYDYLAADVSRLTLLNKIPNQSRVLLFWESTKYFVVLGHSGSVSDDVQARRCHLDSIPILRRVSGGGTVLQGPGCLNYSLIMPITAYPEVKTISGTNQYIMASMATALRPYLPDISVQGYTDLVIGTTKFSGNAQRRMSKALLFHGTFLYNFDCNRISYYLKQPPKQPAYRNNRSHDQFIRNCGLSRQVIETALINHWQSLSPYKS